MIDYAAAHQLPAIYEQDFVTHDGGLMSYGADSANPLTEPPRGRPIFGFKTADLPVEEPTRYLFVLDLKTAKAIETHCAEYGSCACRRSDRMRLTMSAIGT